MGYGILCGEGEEDVYSAGQDCEAGHLDRGKGGLPGRLCNRRLN